MGKRPGGVLSNEEGDDVSTRQRLLSNGWTAGARILAATVFSWCSLTTVVTAQTCAPPEPATSQVETYFGLRRVRFSPEREPAPPVLPAPAGPPVVTPVHAVPFVVDHGGPTIHGAAHSQPAEAPTLPQFASHGRWPVTFRCPGRPPLSPILEPGVPAEKQAATTTIVINGNPGGESPPGVRETHEPAREVQETSNANGMLEITVWHGVIAVAAFGFGSLLSILVGAALLRQLHDGDRAVPSRGVRPPGPGIGSTQVGGPDHRGIASRGVARTDSARGGGHGSANLASTV